MFGRWKIPTKHVYIHKSLIVENNDVKPNVAELNKQLKLDDDPEMRRIKEEMEKKMELRRLQLQKQQEAEVARQMADAQRNADKGKDAGPSTSQNPIVNVGIIETVCRA